MPRAGLPVLIILAAMLGGGPASSQSYAGKQITMISPTTTGSGYDAVARTVARHLPDHLPGAPEVVIQNMPGAGGIRAANYLFNVAPKDGLTIGEVQNGVPFEPFYGDAAAQFDPQKFNWLGSPSQALSVFVLWHNVPVDSIAEAQKQQLVIGAAGASSGGAFYARVAASVFHLKIHLVVGYRGLGDALLAMERGENEGYASAFWSTLEATHSDWIRDHKIKFLLRYNGRALPELAGVPLAEGAAQSPVDKQVIRVATAPFKLGLPFAAPPAIPADRLTLLQQAFAATFSDPAFLADCAKQRLECDDPMDGSALVARIAGAYAVPDVVRRRLRAIHDAPPGN